MKGICQSLCIALVLWGVPFGILHMTAERAEVTGHTELSSVNYGGDNYGVFRKGRYILIITGLAPAKIMMYNGKLVRNTTIITRGRYLFIYKPATPAEEALWRQYFS